MADRYPLIANSSTDQIQELASGDNIDLTGNNIVGVVGVNASGIITATTFVGNITGVAATFTGEVTYEDVTNVDSVGIVTARGGFEIGAAGVGGTITSVGNAEFVGIVSDSKGNVRNIPASTNSTIVAADAGKHISITAGITINASTDFAIGDAVTIFNNQGDGNDETITATGITLYLASDATESGDRTLSGRGVATILCVATDTYVITGAGLS